MKRREPKITLAAARESGVVALIFTCGAPIKEGRFCNHGGEMRLRDAIARWGEGLRLDQARVRCSACGANDEIDVRPRWRKRLGGHGSSPYDPGDAY